MKRRGRATSGVFKGLYLRGETWWYRPPMVQGFQPSPMSLRTRDSRIAVTRREEIVRSPQAASGSLTYEIKAHLEDMQKREKYTLFTVRAKRGVLRQFAEQFPGVMFCDVSRAQAKRFYDYTRVRCMPSTLHKRWMDVRALFSWGIEKRKLHFNPTLGIETKNYRKRVRDRYCQIPLMDQLIRNCQREDLRLVLMLGFHAGMRRNEILHAVPEWFDLRHGVIDMQDTPWKKFNKVKKARSLPMRRELRVFLESYGLRSPFLLRPEIKQRKSLYRWDYVSIFRDYMKTQIWEGKDCAWVTPHVMRHTFASLLAAQGFSLFEISRCMGISVQTTEKVYAHMNPKYRNIDLVR